VVAVQPPPFPSLREQVCRIVFKAITHSDFQERPVGSSDAAKDFRQHAILAVLRKNLVLETVEALGLGVSRLCKQLVDILVLQYESLTVNIAGAGEELGDALVEVSDTRQL
jgi:hypothetical protein